MSAWHGINFILALAALFLILVIFFAFYRYRDTVELFGFAYKIQLGKDSTTDTMITGGDNLYIGAPTQAMTLTVKSSPNNLVGKTIGIKNTGSDIITVTGDGVVIVSDTASITSTNTSFTEVVPGEYAIYVVVGNDTSNTSTIPGASNTFLRLQ